MCTILSHGTRNDNNVCSVLCVRSTFEPTIRITIKLKPNDPFFMNAKRQIIFARGFYFTQTLAHRHIGIAPQLKIDGDEWMRTCQVSLLRFSVTLCKVLVWTGKSTGSLSFITIITFCLELGLTAENIYRNGKEPSEKWKYYEQKMGLRIEFQWLRTELNDAVMQRVMCDSASDSTAASTAAFNENKTDAVSSHLFCRLQLERDREKEIWTKTGNIEKKE